VTEAGKVLRQALALVALSLVAAAAVHLPLIRSFARGEFRESFFRAADYPGVRLITLEETEDLWAGGAAVVLDARAAELFGQGRVPGARNVPAAGEEEALPGEVLALPRDGTLVVYCEGGDCQSSLALARRLHDSGFRDIRVFSGGWEDWTKAGLPTEKDDGPE